MRFVIHISIILPAFRASVIDQGFGLGWRLGQRTPAGVVTANIPAPPNEGLSGSLRIYLQLQAVTAEAETAQTSPRRALNQRSDRGLRSRTNFHMLSPPIGSWVSTPVILKGQATCLDPNCRMCAHLFP